MYTILSFTIKDGIFSDVTGENCKLISPSHAQIGDWECTITEKGLTCICSQSYGLNSKITLKYIIRPNGFSRLVLKIPGSNPIVLKKKWLSKPGKFSLNGKVTLSGGEISHRFANFKSAKET